MLTLEALSPSRHPCTCHGVLSSVFAYLLLLDHRIHEIRAVVCSSLCLRALRMIDRHMEDTGPMPPSPPTWLPRTQGISTTTVCTASLTVPLPPSPKMASGEQYAFTPPIHHPCSQNISHQICLLHWHSFKMAKKPSLPLGLESSPISHCLYSFVVCR